MWKRLASLGFAALAPWVCAAADLTPAELRWRKGAWPAIEFALVDRLPLDIIVQPQAEPGAAPLALAFVKGRCKRVLSMRGNPSRASRIRPCRLPAVRKVMATWSG